MMIVVTCLLAPVAAANVLTLAPKAPLPNVQSPPDIGRLTLNP
jgi:hypothetical protein